MCWSSHCARIVRITLRTSPRVFRNKGLLSPLGSLSWTWQLHSHCRKLPSSVPERHTASLSDLTSPGFVGFPLVAQSHSHSAPRKHCVVRCDAEDREAGGLDTTVDQGGKKIIGKLDDLLRNQEINMSKKELGFGTKPTSASSVTSPEVKSAFATDDPDFRALLAIDGPVLETLSGRLAMFGMASALLAEKATGLSVFEQVFARGNAGLVFFASAVQLLTYASLTPITKGEAVDSRSLGPFTARAEKWNGRLAMVGFLSLIVTEALRRAPLF